MNVAVSVPSPPAPPPEGEGSVVSRLRDFHDKGLAKNTVQLFTLFGLANLLFAKRRVLTPNAQVAS